MSFIVIFGAREEVILGKRWNLMRKWGCGALSRRYLSGRGVEFGVAPNGSKNNDFLGRGLN